MELSAATLDFIHDHWEDNTKKLALQGKKYPQVDMTVALCQIQGRQTAKHKIPSWYACEEIHYPRHLSLEQCSSEATARYKASLCQGDTLTDLTGGFGIDCAFLAEHFKEVHYVEQQPELCRLATHNFSVLGLTQIAVHESDSTLYLEKMQPVDMIYLDPARRDDAGGKTVLLSDCTPDLTRIGALLPEKAKRVMIKLSPMLDITQALKEISGVCEVHIISVRNECKELLFVLSPTPVATPLLTCADLGNERTHLFSFTREEERQAICEYTPKVLRYMYEPNSSLLKAGAFSLPAQRYGLKKLHPHSHLYTSEELHTDFPGRRFEVEAIGPFHKKEWRSLLGDLTQANITVRNFPVSVAEIRKRTRLREGGDTYLFATTLSDGQKVFIRCRKAG
ncbi:MAG: class I SAM-dependent methyltransferase [Bacteroides sp.]|nr:class I SAM-dependent methyltransferase [Bacteroides sp.]